MPAETSRGPRTELRKPSRAGRRVAGLTALAFGLLWAPSSWADAWGPGPSSVADHVAGVSVELASGEVLLAGGGLPPGPGGTPPGTVTTTGELLPVNGTGPFLPAGMMPLGRLYGAATLLPNGKVLIAGGAPSWTSGTPVPKTAVVWSPSGGGTFAATGAMHVGRQALTLTTLPNGQALAVGGSPAFNSPAGSATAELYNPATNKWTLTGSMPSGRLGHTATLLPNCKVLVVGDAHDAVLYNYATGRFSPTGGEGAAAFQRSYQAATLLTNGKVLIAGGVTRANVAVDTASVYNPATGRFTPTPNNMSTPRSEGFAARLLDGKVIVGGGFSDVATGAITDKVDIYNPATNKFSSAASLLSMSFAEGVEAQTLQNGTVSVMSLMSGNQTEIYTPNPATSLRPPAQNCSDLFSIASVGSAARGKLTVKVAVPFAGSIRGVATVPAQSGVPKSIPYGSASSSAGHSGVFTLTFTPGSSARSVLQSKGSLKVSIAVTFTQAHKTPLHRTSTVTAHWS